MPELTSHVFKDTGVTIQIRKVSPMLVMEIKRQFPEPKPPTNKVDYGDGNEVEESNYAHPDYARALEDYNQELEKRIRRLLIKRGVVCNVDKQAVDELREFWKAEYEMDLPESDDLMAYISYICIGTDSDMEELLNAIMRRSQPTELAIAEATRAFQS